MRAWVYGALAACFGCNLTVSDDTAGPTWTPLPDPDFKWVGAFPSYTATEVTTVPVSAAGRDPGSVFAPAAVGSDGSFVTYLFEPTDVMLATQGPDSSIYSGPGTAGSTGLVTSLTFVDATTYVSTTDEPEHEFAFNISTTSVASFAMDVEFVEDMYGPIPTAIAFDGSQAYVFNSMRDVSFRFLTSKALTGSAADIPAMASQLAGSGFIITAFGQLDAAPTYGMVGVSADENRHDAVVAQSFPGTGSGSAMALFDAGYVPVGGYVSNGAPYFIFEK